ncbi:ATP-binding cassette transporter [Coprinopsis cinerea AmutBmut pab1-1]|nr:ATP-binding cassette transporter [Coprinopsis cinerea AmutBmut pab1-1]
MFPFQTEIAAVLAGSALASASRLYFKENGAEGKIRLPEGYEQDERDPFDVTAPEDLIDGHPIEEQIFWNRMRRRKAGIALLLALAAAVNAIALGYAISNDARPESIVAILQLAFTLYILVLSTKVSFTDEIAAHCELVLHLAVLSSVSTLLLLTAAILPDSLASHSDIGSQGLWYGVIALYSAVCVVAVTTPTGPPLNYPPEAVYSDKVVQSITNPDPENVCGVTGSSLWDTLMFSYVTKVVWLGHTASSVEIGDLPLLPAYFRAVLNYSLMRKATRTTNLKVVNWKPRLGSGWDLWYRLMHLNRYLLSLEVVLGVVTAASFYVQAFFIRFLISYLEVDPGREDRGWGWVYIFGIIATNAIGYLIAGQLWFLSATTIPVRFRVQLNSILYAKTLVRKDVASTAPSAGSKYANPDGQGSEEKEQSASEFASKGQIMTLMTTDVDKIADFPWWFSTLIVHPVEIVIGTYLLYDLLGVSCFYGLALICLFLPLNHLAVKTFVGIQENLMKARDERVSLMNEILGGIRMLKFMAWERSFEKRVMGIREKELKYQKRHYRIQTLWIAVWNLTPILVVLVTFWHFAIVRQQPLTPSVAFTSVCLVFSPLLRRHLTPESRPQIIVFSQMKFAFNALPETFVNLLQCLVSLRRIEKYMSGAEVSPVLPLEEQGTKIAFQSCTVTWPQGRSQSQDGSNASTASSTPTTPSKKFVLVDLTLDFPRGELSLICGKLGSGKSLLLLSLLGEADILSGQILCPRSPPDSIASSANAGLRGEWVVEGLCAYVPQAAWLRNASIKENILFGLPYNEKRYQKTLKACALVNDLEILEDGDESEIGERGVNLSGGQKARVSLARAVYSRASILFLDDVLSAVDAHTAHHLYHQCLRGELMQGRTVILVSHHVHLCSSDAAYIVALDNGRVVFDGDRDSFNRSGLIKTLGQTTHGGEKDDLEEKKLLVDIEEKVLGHGEGVQQESNSTAESTHGSDGQKKEKKPPRKLIEDEVRAVGRIKKDVWAMFFQACGSPWFWSLFVLVFVLAAVSVVVENNWLRYWSASALENTGGSPIFYIGIYTAINFVGLIVGTGRWLVLYDGSIRASTVLYKKLLETVLFANIRFHDTVSRGRLLNRFGKDFEGIDSQLAGNLGYTTIMGLSALTSVITVSVVGGPVFIAAIAVLGVLYWNAAKIYGQTSRDMRRLDSVSRSPLYSIYGETISGVPVLRAFGASTKLLREMLRCVDTNSNPFYWMWAVNRWLSIRFNLISTAMVGATGLACLVNPSINASLAGFALAFATTITNDLLFVVRRFVALEQSMVALERVKEYSELKREPAEFIEPRPPASWPSQGEIQVEDLTIRYAPDLPDVLHNLSFTIKPGEKVGILGRTGSGKSTLALSFFRFVEPTKGRILVDGLDLSKVGLTDVRSRITIIPQDPIILSGTLRSTLDVFDEYEDAEIYEALRRVHLLPASDNAELPDTINVNVFKDLDSPVSEGGENFSTGEKQLLCMARAILKRSKILVMDEATAR